MSGMVVSLVKKQDVDAVDLRLLGAPPCPLLIERSASLGVFLYLVEFLLEIVRNVFVGLNKEVDLVLFLEFANDLVGLANGIRLEEAAVVTDFRDGGSAGQPGGEQPAGGNRRDHQRARKGIHDG